MKKNKQKKKAADASPQKEAQFSHDSSLLRTPNFERRTIFAERLRGIAFVLILACVAGRAFIAEMPFRSSPIQVSEVVAFMTRGGGSSIGMVNWQELARVGFATLLLTVGALWLIAGVIGGELRVRRAWLAIPLLGFVAWSFVSAWRAVDARSAWMVWLEQFSLLAAGFVMIQLCTSRRRFVFVVAVLAAVGLSLSLKSWMQLGWEKAEAAQMFRLYGPEQLANMGLTPDDPKAKAYVQRILSPTPTAYFGLANVLASVLALTLAVAVGLTLAKTLYARHCRRRDGAMPSGHIRPAFAAAVLTILAVIPVAVILALTRSRGGIGAAAFVLVVMLIALRYRTALARRWKLAVASVGVLLVLGVAGLVAYGLARDRLPGGKTMSIRWFYWTGSAVIAREQPLWGVGPGNFGRAYLRHRRAEAEEAVKTPHNVIAHAVTQYGLPGGALYLIVLGGMLVLAWKPATNAENMLSGKGGSLNSLLWSAGCVTLGVFLCRGFFGDAAEDPILLILEGVVPAVLFAASLGVERWIGGVVEDLPDASIRAMRIALAAGCSAFVLHNFVSYSLWTPGPAGLFWVALGAAVAVGEARNVTLRRLTILPALLGVVGVAAAVVVLVLPVADRLIHTRKAVDALLRHRSQALAEAEKAAWCDPLDAHAAANTSRLYLVFGIGRSRENIGSDSKPMIWAREAIRRNDDANAYRLVAQTARELKLPETDRYWLGAIERDPVDIRLRLDYATWLVQHRKMTAAGVQLDEAERIDGQLRAFNPESIYLLSENEQRQITDLRRQIRGK